MIRLSHFSKIHVSFAAIITLIGVVLLCSMVKTAQAADPNSPAAKERIVTVHDNGASKGVITTKSSLREILKDMNVQLAAHDRTEPAADTQLNAGSYDVNVYRARPVVIKDGATSTKVMSSYRTGKQIAAQAGITVHDQDETSLKPSADVIEDGAAEVMTIKRATPVTVTLYGKTEQTYTMAKTVGDMLKEKNVVLEANDTLTPAAATPITASMTITVSRNGKQQLTQEESVPFAVEQTKDAAKPVGSKEITTPGVEGKRSVTYEIIMQNGVETARKELSSTVTKEPVKQIEVIGAKAPTLPAGSHTDWLAAAGVAPSDYGYADFIFGKESGWRPNAASPNGYYGLGQTNLAKLSAACPNWQTDPVCQIRLFTQYASRYGGWEGSYNFWLSHHWW